jgi:ferredoxin
VTYGHIFGEWEELIEEFLLGTIILGLMFISTIFISRAWCKYLCPFVGILGPLSKISWLKINRDKNTCTDCKACNKNCPMDVEIASSSKVNSMECIECGSCESFCPVPGTLNRKSKLPAFKVKAFLIPILAVVFFTGTYGIAKVSGIWKSVGDIASYKDIRGSNSIDQVAISAGVSVHKFLEIAGLPEEMEKDAEQMIKTFQNEEYMKKYNLSDDFETDVIREAFAKIRGEEFIPEDDHSPEKPSDIKPGKKLVWGTDVKGSTPLKVFFESSGKSRSEFIKKFSLPQDISGETTLREIRDQHGKEMEDLKAFFGIE